MSALLHPTGRTKEDIKWGLVAHTLAMFSAVTIYTTTNLNMPSIGYIDNRGFLGDGVLFPGPLGYQFLVNSGAITITADTIFALNGWLANGLLVGSVSISVAVIAMLVECAGLYAVAFILFIGSWGAGSPAQFIFLSLLGETQVRAVCILLPDASLSQGVVV